MGQGMGGGGGGEGRSVYRLNIVLVSLALFKHLNGV